MKEKLLIGKLGLAMALGTVGLLGILPLRAQDDVKEKKDEPVALEQPVDSPVAAKESDDEDNGHAWHGGEPSVMVGNDFVLKEDEVTHDVLVISGNATINGHVTGNLVVVAGSAKVEGRVDGKMAVVLGSATLGSNAKIRRDVCIVGGTLTREPGANIGGKSRVFSTLGVF